MQKGLKAPLKASLPLPNPYSEYLIRSSLGLAEEEGITLDRIEEAIQKAIELPLRQRVGSCFVTALAIFLQKERKDLMRQDLLEILYKGSISRVYEKSFFYAPVAPNCKGKEALLRAWEYTLVSFVDRESFHLKERLRSLLEEILGDDLFASFQKELEDRVEAFNTQAEELESQADRLEQFQRAFSASVDLSAKRSLKQQIRWQGAEFETKERDLEEAKKEIAKLKRGYQSFIDRFEEKIEKELLEVYDPSIVLEGRAFHDSPAGFRMVYRAGNQNPMRYQSIGSKEEFLSTLMHLVEESFEEGLEAKHQVRDKLLLKSVLDKIEQEKPWIRISGGSLHRLIEGYFSSQDPLQEETISVETPLDFAIFYLDFLHSLSSTEAKLFIDNPEKSFLATTPTHAFSLIPFFLSECYEKNQFSYSWLRLRLIEPALAFYKEIEQERKELLAKSESEDQVDIELKGRYGKKLPFIPFGDTNWASGSGQNYYLAFQLHPTKKEVELWCTTLDGKEGQRLKEDFFKGEWSIFSRRFQYGGDYVPPRSWQRV